jgi:short-subunit dehydrogenase
MSVYGATKALVYFFSQILNIELKEKNLDILTVTT